MIKVNKLLKNDDYIKPTICFFHFLIFGGTLTPKSWIKEIDCQSEASPRLFAIHKYGLDGTWCKKEYCRVEASPRPSPIDKYGLDGT